MKNYILAPGCALYLYKPHLITKLHYFLYKNYDVSEQLITCCRHTPDLPEDVTVINICPGCDKRYRENYDKPRTVSLWELLMNDDDFHFPDYHSKEMTIIDACPTRDQDRIHNAVRTVLERMNISVIEPSRTKRRSTCCGDTFYGKRSIDEVERQMKMKAESMPIDDIIVYCVSCCKSMFTGGKRPKYLIDLIFSEDTIPLTTKPEEWHSELDEYIEKHRLYRVLNFPT